jgi:hypothetical protein
MWNCRGQAEEKHTDGRLGSIVPSLIERNLSATYKVSTRRVRVVLPASQFPLWSLNVVPLTLGPVDICLASNAYWLSFSAAASALHFRDDAVKRGDRGL